MLPGWKRSWPPGRGVREVQFANLSDQLGAIAVQGPRVVSFIDTCFPGVSLRGTHVAHASDLKKNSMAVFPFRDAEVQLARTGYTGEDGFEIIAANALLEPIWKNLLDAGRHFGLVPTGLGARDTLRTEVCYPLYGHELDEKTTPIEAGLGYFVALDKPEFIGRAVLAAQKSGGTGKKCVAFKMTERSAPPRPHYPLWSPGGNSSQLGQVTSGTQSPSLGIGIGLGYVPPSSAQPGTAIEVEIRGKRAAAQVVPKPIYRKA